MIIIPTIELQNGQCVSLNRGDVADPTIWHVDPVAKAHEFGQSGAELLHVTDLDAVTDEGVNREIVTDIIRKSETSVQLAGGFRTMEHIEEALDRGVGRIVIGTAAVRDPEFVKTAAKLHPDQIVLAVDVYKGRVVVDGWRASTAFDPIDFVNEFNTAPLAAILVTDVDTYAGDSDGSVGVISKVADAARSPVIASGIVNTLDDISRLKYVRNIHAALVGRVLFSKAITLEEALAVARAVPAEPVAQMI